MTNQPVKYKAAIIGCGRIASDFDDDPLMKKTYGISTHAGAYSDNPHIDLVAAADISEEKLNKFGQRWGVNSLYGNYKELLAKEDIDILSICTWNTTHLEILEEAVKYKVRAIFCEKPISNSIENADRMVTIAKEHHIPVFINHRRRWDDLYLRLRELIKQGELGNIQQVSCYYSAGIANTCSHLFDVLRMLFGEIESVCAFSKRATNKDDPDLDGYLVLEGGVTATLQSLDASQYILFEFDIYGTKGRIRVEDNGFNISYWEMKNSVESLGYKALFKEKNPIKIEPKAIMKNAVQNIVDCLSSGAQPASSADDGLKSLEVICAFHASVMEGNKMIHLPLKQRNLTIISK